MDNAALWYVLPIPASNGFGLPRLTFRSQGTFILRDVFNQRRMLPSLLVRYVRFLSTVSLEPYGLPIGLDKLPSGSSNHGVVRPLRLPHATSPDKNDRRGMSCDDINNRIPSSSAFEDKIAVLEKEGKLLTAELDLLEKEWLFLNMLAKIKHVCRPDGTPVLRFFAWKKRKRQKERIQANVSLLIRSFIW